jgi:glucose/arabinose dehydrogenase/plastocyanin/type 1 glutamine amidotransferase
LARALGRVTGALVVAVALVAGSNETGTAQAAKAKPVAKPTVLIVTASEGKRSSLARVADKSLARAARSEGQRPVLVSNRFKLTATAIRGAAAVVIAANRGTVFSPALEDVLNQRVRAGGGVVILGSAAALQPKSQDYVTLVGAQPSGTDTPKKAEVQFVDHVHPATTQVPRRWSVIAPWVSLKKNPTGRVHVLGWVSERSYTPGEKLGMGNEHPVTWCRELGEGRAVTSTLGLTKGIWTSMVWRRFLRGAIAYAAGRRSGDCGATVWSNWKRTVIDEDITDGTQLDVGADGRVYYIEHLGSTLKIYDPVNDIVKESGYIPSVPGLGQGLLGLVLDPGFVKNRWIYVYYHLEGLIGRLSRFTLDKNDQLDRLSEKVLLRIQNTGIDHNGGGLTMAANGDLFLAIGANDMPHFDGQYGSRGSHIPVITQILETNSEQTTQNTDSLLGKVLRIHPEKDGTYSIPKGNMFPPGTAGTRPEIYTMGHRNAFHVKYDDLTGELLEGDVGPDAVADDPERGPKGYDEFNLIKGPGNYGWPFCVGPNLPYRDKDSITGLGTGEYFDCNNIVNPTSPGIKELGPASKPWIWYPYGVGTDFPEMSEAWNGGTDGGRLAIPGPRYRPFEGSRMPLFYDGSWFIADWTRNWLKQVIVDDDGKPLRIQRFAPDRGTQAPIDMDIGADGSLYVIEWGGQSIPVGNPLAAKVVRYQYVPKCGTCDPTVLGGGTAAPGVGVEGNVIAGPLAQSTGFLTTTVTLAQGSNLTFTNLDVIAHNVASKAITEDGRRLFAAPNVATGTSVVEGAEKIKAGKYEFLCTVHPSMTGTLEVQ